ncbi:MAG: HAMP domain-containing sensor histidine kinase [Firmicutes bacterium]|nr:HAMP domain-containing sensor histidine kinase [Bacillota bacterium]
MGCRGIWVVDRAGLVVVNEAKEDQQWVAKIVEEARALMQTLEDFRMVPLADHQWCYLYRLDASPWQGVVAVWEDRAEDEAWRLKVQGMAHDINNLLQVVSGHLELWPTRLPEQKAGALAEAQWMLERAEELVAQLGIMAMTGEPSEGSADVVEVLQHLAAWVRRPNIRLQLEIPSGPVPLVKAPTTACVEIFHNLLQNAYDAMPDGGLVQVRVHSDSDGVTVTVQDSGDGLLSLDADVIFAPYYSTKTHGRGLGLYRVRELVEQYQGRIEVRSFSGQGSCFAVSLPRVTDGRQ